MSMASNISCGTLLVAPSEESSTLEVVEDLQDTQTRTGQVTRPTDGRCQAMPSSTLGEPCHGCRSNRVLLQLHQPTQSILPGPKHLRNLFGFGVYCLNSARACASRLPSTLTIEPPISLPEIQSTMLRQSTLMCIIISSVNASRMDPSTSGS